MRTVAQGPHYKATSTSTAKVLYCIFVAQTKIDDAIVADTDR